MGKVGAVGPLGHVRKDNILYVLRGRFGRANRKKSQKY